MQIILFLIFILLTLLVVVSKRNEFSKNSKIIITLFVTILTVGIYFYTSTQENSAEKNREIVNSFKQGKTLICKKYKVSNKRFIYVSGTQTFVPKNSETTLEGVIVRVSTCKEE